MSKGDLLGFVVFLSACAGAPPSVAATASAPGRAPVDEVALVEVGHPDDLVLACDAARSASGLTGRFRLQVVYAVARGSGAAAQASLGARWSQALAAGDALLATAPRGSFVDNGLGGLLPRLAATIEDALFPVVDGGRVAVVRRVVVRQQLLQ